MAGATRGSTGTHVLIDGENAENDISLPCDDARLACSAAGCADTDRVLLKLDLEGHELDALAGRDDSCCDRVEVMVSEMQFYEIERTDIPVFAEFDQPCSTNAGLCCTTSPPFRRGGATAACALGDAIFVRRGRALAADDSWE